MPLPDKYENEPSVQLDQETYTQWVQAQAAADAWQKLADGYKKALIAALGDADAGMVGDLKVVTYRPESRYATSRLVSENPELAQHYMRTMVKEEFSMDEFRAQHPDIAERYRVRSFRAVTG